MPKIGIATIKDFWKTLISAGPLISPRIDDLILKHTKTDLSSPCLQAKVGAVLTGLLFIDQDGSRNQKFTSLTMLARLFLFGLIDLN
jgi:hypothetical protein